MSSIQPKPFTLEEFLEDKGLSCPMCTDAFDDIKAEKKPVQLPCQQHNLCMGCIKEHFERLTICPLDRKPIRIIQPFVVNSQVINSVEMAKELWNARFGKSNSAPATSASSSAASASAPKVQKVEPALPPVPANFGIITPCDQLWEYRDVTEVMTAALPTIQAVMGWNGDAAVDLSKEFLKVSQEWYLFKDEIGQQTKGLAQLKRVDQTDTHWEAHWVGIMENSPDLYLDLYKKLLIAVENTRKYHPTDWKEVSLTTVYNYDTEEKWLKSVQWLLMNANIHFDVVRLYKPWGTQVKITAFPCCKAGHNATPFQVNNNHRLEQRVSFREQELARLNNYLTVKNLNLLFELWSQLFNHPGAVLAGMREAFLNHPEDFFIYTIDGQAKGYIRFERRNGLTVQESFLMHDSIKYADHFLQQFLTWAKTQSSCAKGVSAREITFSNSQTPYVLQEALKRVKV